MPRGVASIDPQDFPLLPRRPRLRLARRAVAPPRSSRSSPPFLPPSPLFVPRYRRVPLRRPDHPSWFTSLFTVSLSHLSAPLAHTGSHRLLSSGDAEPHHPDGGAALLRRSIEADALSSNHAESDGSDELLRRSGAGSLGCNPSNRDQSRAAGNEGEAPHRWDFGFLPEDDCVKFLRRPDFNPAH